jgi:tetratricopeptide (TPR) repeat protein
VVETQLDLFGDRHLQLEGARRALTEGRAAEASRELARLCVHYPGDPGIAGELDLAHTLQQLLGEIDAAPPARRPALLVAAVRGATPGIRNLLLRRAAAELMRDAPTALVDGRAASALLVEAGDLQAALQAAEAAASHSPRARFLAYLADVELRLERTSSAHERYREALVLDPHDVDWDELADEDVRSLPDIARTELELDHGVAWAAPVGVVLGVLPPGEPPPLPCGAAPDRPPPSALVQARRFLAALIRSMHEPGARAIDARREMRALAPRLLAAYLERRRAAHTPLNGQG